MATTRELSLGEALKTIEAHRQAGHLDAAVQLCREALDQVPDYAPALHLQGLIEFDRDNRAAAIDLIERAADRQAQSPTIWLNLALVYARTERLEPAVAALERCLAVDPATAKAKELLARFLSEIGKQHLNAGRLDDAIAQFDRALTFDPERAETHCARASANYLRGDFAEYEWRWRYRNFPDTKKAWPGPEWDGSDPAGRTIAVYPEQGLGDTIQFCRFLPELARRGAAVVFGIAPTPLGRLLESLDGVDRLVGLGGPIGSIDAHLPLLSLPHRLGTTLATVPARVPYLAPPPADVARWADRLAHLDGLRVGLAWAGEPVHPNDRARSLDVADVAPLMNVPGASFVSLQVGARAGEAQQLGDGAILPLAEAISDFADTAAIIANLDVVVSVDTAVAHLAGALARPTLLMLPQPPDFRWLHDRPDTPWYPTLQLIRQPTPGDWSTVIDAVGVELTRRAGALARGSR